MSSVAIDSDNNVDRSIGPCRETRGLRSIRLRPVGTARTGQGGLLLRRAQSRQTRARHLRGTYKWPGPRAERTANAGASQPGLHLVSRPRLRCRDRASTTPSVGLSICCTQAATRHMVMRHICERRHIARRSTGLHQTRELRVAVAPSYPIAHSLQRNACCEDASQRRAKQAATPERTLQSPADCAASKLAGCAA